MTAGPTTRAPSVRLVLDVPAREDEWVLPEEDVPESNPHHARVHLLELILNAYVARTKRDALVATESPSQNLPSPAFGSASPAPVAGSVRFLFGALTSGAGGTATGHR